MINIFSRVKLEKSNLTLQSYTNENIVLLGLINVKVETNNGISKVMPLYVVTNGGSPLLGRDWLEILNLCFCSFIANISHVNKINAADVKNCLIKQFPEVFCDKLGTY